MRTKVLVSMGVVVAFLFGLSVALGNGSAAITEKNFGSKPCKPGMKDCHPGSGELDWTQAIIKSTGIGAVNPDIYKRNPASARPMCLRAATVVAQRNLLEIVKGVNIDSQTTVENFMTTSDVVKTQVQGVLRGAVQLGDPVYKDDGTCEVTMGMKVVGPLASAIIPSDVPFGTQQVPQGPEKRYSGVIIDATNMGAVPAMAPKILDQDNKEVYGTMDVSREYAVERGVVGYAKSVDQAKGSDRFPPGLPPLIIKAVKATGAKKADVIISNDDAAKLRDANVDLTFLKECRVIIVL